MEPKFKKGDWIRNVDRPKHTMRVNSYYYSNNEQEFAYKSRGVVFYESNSKAWIPENNEWVVLIIKKQDCFKVFKWDEDKHKNLINQVEPFRYELPTWIRDEGEE